MFIHNEYMHEYIVYGCSWLCFLWLVTGGDVPSDQTLKCFFTNDNKKGFKMVNQIDGLDTNLEFCIVLFSFYFFLNKINNNAKSDAFLYHGQQSTLICSPQDREKMKKKMKRWLFLGFICIVDWT